MLDFILELVSTVVDFFADIKLNEFFSKRREKKAAKEAAEAPETPESPESPEQEDDAE